MARYRERPKVFDAVQFNGDVHELELFKLLCKHPVWGIIDCGDYLTIENLEGKMRVDIGDFVIRSADGKVSVKKPDDFEATYIEVSHYPTEVVA